MTAAKPARVLLATDGSERAAIAVDLVGAIPWPTGTQIQLVSVMPDAEFDHEASEILRAARTRLERGLQGRAGGGVSSTAEVLYGRPASRIVQQAEHWQAELVVVGSRGHGTLASMLLGSVAAEVVDQSPAPVLVCRSVSLTRAVLAHDGSPCAGDAERLASEWAIFDRVPVDVLSVSEVNDQWRVASAPALYAARAHEDLRAAQARLEMSRSLAEAAASRLRDAGRETQALVAEGQIAAKVLETARARGADMIIVGTRGLTGLTRAVLGSVARNVLLNAPVSVLVACSGPEEATG